MTSPDPARALVEAMGRLIPDEKPPSRLATVTALNSNGVRVLFDGEAVASTRDYRQVGSMRVGDRVVMLRVGSTCVALGVVSTSGSAGHRGGRYRCIKVGWTGGVVQQSPLTTTVFGDADCLSGGDFVVPAGAAGMWAFTLTWERGAGAGSRTFMQLGTTSSLGNQPYRTTLTVGEDVVTLSATMLLAAGDSVRVSSYSADATNTTTGQTFTLDALRA